MTKQTNITVPRAGQLAREEDDDGFGGLPALQPFDLKKEELAAQLSAMLSFSGLTRSEVADRLDCKKSRMTSILSGKNNPTMKTIWQVAQVAGFDFDVVFRPTGQKRALQPWQTARNAISNVPLTSRGTIYIELTVSRNLGADWIIDAVKPMYFKAKIPLAMTREQTVKLTELSSGQYIVPERNHEQRATGAHYE